MLLPDKHVTVENSPLAQAEKLFMRLSGAVTVADAWCRALDVDENMSFDNFVVLLDILFSVGIIDYIDDLLVARITDD